MSLIIFFVVSSITLYAQDEQAFVHDWEAWFEEYAREQRTEGSELQEEELSALWDNLQAMADNPLPAKDINQDYLERLPFLNSFQINRLVSYILDKKSLYSIYDLKLVDGWDITTIKRFSAFIRFDSDKLSLIGEKSLKQRANTEMAMVYGRKIGDKVQEGKSKWIGEDYYSSVRFRHQSKHKFSMGVTAEKDMGEPFSKDIHKGFDSYSAHMAFKNRGRLRQVILGDYRFGFGYGLVINQGFVRGTYSWQYQAGKKSPGLREKYATSESGFMRGMAVEYEKGKSRWVALLSALPLDATVSTDNDGQWTISSLTETGLHRTPREWKRRNTTRIYTMGIFYVRQYYHGQWGVSALYYSFGKDRLLQPPGYAGIEELKHLRNNHNIGSYYEYMPGTGRLKVYGEGAVSATHGYAAVQGINYSNDNIGFFNIIGRALGPTYWSYYGQTLTHYRHAGNEWGVYASAELPKTSKQYTLGMYADVYRSMRPRWRASKKVRGLEWSVYAMHTVNRYINWNIRYRHLSDHKGKSRHSLRGLFTFVPNKQYALYIEPSYSLAKNTPEEDQARKSSKGLGVSFKLDGQDVQGHWKYGAHYAYYNTDGWDSRLYLPQQRMRYVYSSAFGYGKGHFTGLCIRYNNGHKLSVESKWTYRSGNELSPPSQNIFFSVRINV
ncbi:hypothetical protein [Porphyromonas pogonae]|uniref:hypothetical protein n=1 Tax=Porphyromonas pogonae TaxID=867595 RepID=UPI002E7A18F6|nr:hypothetical protein [Porphyromonas pogonae]